MDCRVFADAHLAGLDFADFDKRGYRTVDARVGYAEWAATYEDTVKDAMDLDLLDVIDVEWGGTVVDLGCGTGRTGSGFARGWTPSTAST